MFGAIVSATDPVAVVALLKEMCSRARLQTLIEGESLLNYGTVIILFTLFLSLATQIKPEFNTLAVIVEFFRVVLIGAVIGVVVAGISFAFIGSLFNDNLMEIALTLVLSYVVFYLSEHVFHASGVADLANLQYLAIIFIGVLIIRTVVIVALMPILARIGIGLTKEK